MRVYWLSSFDLTPGQERAIHDLHGPDVEIVNKHFRPTTDLDLLEFIKSHRDGFIYTVADKINCAIAMGAGAEFGMFGYHPNPRKDGSFGTASVYHVANKNIEKVWMNENPEKDEGESLIAVQR